MLWTILGLSLLLWVLGMVTSHRLNGLIHVLPAVAVIALILRLASGMVQASLEAQDKLLVPDKSSPVLASQGRDENGGR